MWKRGARRLTSRDRGQRRQALEKAVAEGTPLERRHQTIRLRDRHWNPTSVASFRRRRPSPYERNAAISWHFEREPIPYALELTGRLGRRDSNLCILESGS